MKSFWLKVKQFLMTPYGKAYLVFITLTKLYLVYQWALEYVKSFGGEVANFIGGSIAFGENAAAIGFTAICGYYTVKAIINIFRTPPKPVEEAA
ncbi:hypothetical protein C9I98_20420 [Photobacterium sanctipauli]|uniref:Uncharacterized protein n=1 Tax=Photobacterium sanctipauli TaxID=1342794 RepID=A0A2T3NN27_9GAMM|nr:hypothetical protein [Photobacterium sanctipauli]PSW16911.1 hypothetical protein C9I98_20420 [Photobacterium sanctipauli]